MIRAHKSIDSNTYNIKLSGNQDDCYNLKRLVDVLEIDGFKHLTSEVNMKTGRIVYNYIFRYADSIKDFMYYYRKLRKQLIGSK